MVLGMGFLSPRSFRNMRIHSCMMTVLSLLRVECTTAGIVQNFQVRAAASAEPSEIRG
jgi:hypothetical protein